MNDDGGNGGGDGRRQDCHFLYMFVQYEIDTHSAHLFVYVCRNCNNTLIPLRMIDPSIKQPG